MSASKHEEVPMTTPKKSTDTPATEPTAIPTGKPANGDEPMSDWLSELLDNPPNNEGVPPLVVEGAQTFRKDLPELLKHYRRQWVAYSGAKRIAIGKKHDAVYQQCLDLGYDHEEFVMRCIEPE